MILLNLDAQIVSEMEWLLSIALMSLQALIFETFPDRKFTGILQITNVLVPALKNIT